MNINEYKINAENEAMSESNHHTNGDTCVMYKIKHVYGKSTRLLNMRHRQTDKPKDKYWIPSTLPTSEDK